MTDLERTADLVLPTAPREWPLAPADAGPQMQRVPSPTNLLRGRYRWALAIGAVIAAAGVAAGVLLPRPLYRSVGLIDIAPKVPRVLYESDEKGLLPMFDAFVASQAAQAATRRVVDMAMASPEWRRVSGGASDEDVARFQKQLAVSHPKYTEHVEVAYLDEDPEVAMVAVNEVIKAYMTIVDERESRSGSSTLQILENQRSLASNELNRLRGDVLSVTEDLGEQPLAARYDFDIAQLNKLDAAISDLDMEIAIAKGSGDAKPDAKSDAKPRSLGEQEIALKDSTMDQLLLAKATAESKLIYLRVHEGYGEKHPDVLTGVAQLETLQRRITERAEAYRNTATPGGAGTLEEKEARRAHLAELHEATQAETKRLGQKRATLASLEQERTLQTERLDEVKKRLEQINVESEVRGRISVVAYGDRPVEPDTDRRAALAALGGIGGMGLGFGIVLLWGLREAKVRHLVDVEGRTSPCRFLGVVPEVTGLRTVDDVDDPAVLADYCVHHLRTMLQVGSGGSGRVVAVTSPTPAAGKTTLSLALGMSFAASGARTLLVDCDFVGHGLTSSMRSLVCEGASRALLGRAAIDEEGDGPPTRRGLLSGLVEARQLAFDDVHIRELLDEVLRHARAGDEKFARTARALQALARPAASALGGVRGDRGIMGALSGRSMDACVVETGVTNLSLLPVGDAGPDDAERISPSELQRLIDGCRENHDMVLIDTGPVLGSLETTLVASAVDDVLLVVARGERRPRVNESLTRLRHIGADVAGMVFNRATNADVAESSYASRSRSRPMAAA
jgi:Mrp family chromosome partitioning ATPase